MLIMTTSGQQDIRKLKINTINITFMFNISPCTYVQNKRSLAAFIGP